MRRQSEKGGRWRRRAARWWLYILTFDLSREKGTLLGCMLLFSDTLLHMEASATCSTGACCSFPLQHLWVSEWGAPQHLRGEKSLRLYVKILPGYLVFNHFSKKEIIHFLGNYGVSDRVKGAIWWCRVKTVVSVCRWEDRKEGHPCLWHIAWIKSWHVPDINDGKLTVFQCVFYMFFCCCTVAVDQDL